MASPSRSLRALCAGIGATACVMSVLVGISAAPARADVTEARGTHHAVDRPAPPDPDRPPDDSPLSVRINYLAPSYLPEKGTIEVRGTVTNRDDETWSTINLYTFLGDDLAPMRTPAQLAAAVDTPYDAYVGGRVLDGDTDKIDRLEPGQSQTFAVTVPVSQFDVTTGGVYWFGVHALGQSPGSPSDGLADGRARTFLPYVPPKFHASLPTALVVPMTRFLRFKGDGSLAGLPRWERALEGSGRLNELLQFVSAANGPVTWVLDPALLDAVDQIARGNPPRSLGPTDQPAEQPSGTPTPTGGADEGGDGDQPAPPATDSPSAGAASDWLDELPAALGANEVLTLPYGNLDVAASLHRDPTLYELAIARKSKVLQALGTETRPVVSSPEGYLDAESIARLDPDSTVLLTDLVFARRAPAVVKVGPRRVVVTSDGSSSGGPGPGPAITSVALRQRILSEAAVRVIKEDRRPLVVVLPTEWDHDDAAEFFAGLDVDWIDLDTVNEISLSEPAEVVPPQGLSYPPSQEQRELDAEAFAGVDALIESGDTLQSLLTRNNDVGGQITEQALAGASYPVRDPKRSGRASVDRSRRWVDHVLGSVKISAPRGVTLSSLTGGFGATIENGLDEPVTVSVVAESDSGLEVTGPEPMTLAPHSRTPVPLTARATSNRVHNVTLRVTDAAGRPLGSSDELPIRSTQVSDVIWLIMGTGVGLLFLAIAVRLVRRIRAVRRGSPDPSDRPDMPEPAPA